MMPSPPALCTVPNDVASHARVLADAFQKLTWLPCLGVNDGKLAHQAFASYSDHVFLLRKGVPASRLSFNVVNIVDDVDTNACIDNMTSNDNAEYASITTGSASINATATDVPTATATSNPKDDAGSPLPSSSNDDVSNCNSSRPASALDGIGRGYDASIPAVFKAKV